MSVGGGIAIAHTDCIYCSSVEAYPLWCDICGNGDDVFHYHPDESNRDKYVAICRCCGNEWEGMIEKPKY